LWLVTCLIHIIISRPTMPGGLDCLRLFWSHAMMRVTLFLKVMSLTLTLRVRSLLGLSSLNGTARWQERFQVPRKFTFCTGSPLTHSNFTEIAVCRASTFESRTNLASDGTLGLYNGRLLSADDRTDKAETKADGHGSRLGSGGC